VRAGDDEVEAVEDVLELDLALALEEGQVLPAERPAGGDPGRLGQ
jgi:hypothetical protein